MLRHWQIFVAYIDEGPSLEQNPVFSFKRLWNVQQIGRVYSFETFAPNSRKRKE